MKKVRAGFTMIELIFVIVIIGILASVAIPKLAATRDDAEAATCIHEVGQLFQEISATYTKVGHSKFINIPIEDMTNIALTEGPEQNGIFGPGINDGGIAYVCGGSMVIIMAGYNAGTDYNITMTGFTPNDGVPPAAAIAMEGIKDNLLGGENWKQYSL